MYVLGIDPGGTSGAGLLHGTFENNEVALCEKVKNLKELALFMPQYRNFKNKLLVYFSEKLGRVATWDDVVEWIDHIYIEDQYLDTKFLNPQTVKVIIQKRTWWEVVLFQDFGNIIKSKYPNSWQAVVGASGRGLKRPDRERIVKQYCLDRWGLKLTADPACALGIALSGMKDEEAILREKQKPLTLK